MDAEDRGRATGLAYRELRPEGGGDRPVALLLHGYPESSYMWKPILPALARAGWRAVAPDLAGFGDSPPDRPGTWERHAERLAAFHAELALGPVVGPARALPLGRLRRRHRAPRRRAGP